MEDDVAREIDELKARLDKHERLVMRLMGRFTALHAGLCEIIAAEARRSGDPQRYLTQAKEHVLRTIAQEARTSSGDLWDEMTDAAHAAAASLYGPNIVGG